MNKSSKSRTSHFRHQMTASEGLNAIKHFFNSLFGGSKGEYGASSGEGFECSKSHAFRHWHVINGPCSWLPGLVKSGKHTKNHEKSTHFVAGFLSNKNRLGHGFNVA